MTEVRAIRVLALIETIGLGGGAERLLVTLGKELRAQGIDLEVAALRRTDREVDGDLRDAGIPLLRGPDVTGRVSTPLLVEWAARTLRRGRFDVAWGHMFLGNVCSMLAAATNPHVRAVITLHGTAQDSSLGFRARMALKRGLGKRFATAKVTVSHATARDYDSAMGWGDVEVIHNGIEARAVEPTTTGLRTEVRSRLGVPLDRRVVVIPARLASAKGHDVALDALARMHRAGSGPLLVCAGQGPLAGALEAQATSLGVSNAVRFLGAIPQPVLFDWIRAADCVALPSNEEPFGLAAAEAMALGVPTVLSRVGGFVEIVGDADCTVFVPPRDPAALAEAVTRVLNDAALQTRLAERGRTRVVANFDASVVGRQWADRLRAAAAAPSLSPLARAL